MTQNQIAYQNLKEGIRHNLATESISSTSNAINREHYIRADQAALSQAESAARNADTNAYNASINYMNALSNQRQADASLQNAASNQRNAETNARNADTNRRNAETNARNADISQFNANVNARNSDINLMNAMTQARNADSQATKVSIEGSIAPSTIAANYGKAEHSKASAFKSTVDSYGEHPAVAALVASGAINEISKAGTAVVGGIKDFFTSDGDPSPVTVGVGLVNRVTPKSTVGKGGGGARHTKQGKSRKVGSRVVHN